MAQSKPLEHVHFLLYKPVGYLSQFVSNARHERNKKFLGELYNFPPGVMPIGRLDKDSEGVLLLTSDGMLSNKICSSAVEKEYFVQLDGEITEQALSHLREGVVIANKKEFYNTQPCRVRKLEQEPDFPARSKKIRDARHGPTCWVSITIKEGKFRQVRKMTAAVGFPTLRLVRIRLGCWHIEAMQPGEVIKITELQVD